jgi:hypothetical protein
VFSRLVTLPLKLTGKVLRLYLAGGKFVVSLAREFVESETAPAPAPAPRPVRRPAPVPREEEPPPPVQPSPSPPPEVIEAEPVRQPEPEPVEPEPEPVEPPTPLHVSEEPELVGESADPEAADTATAEVHVAEPWEGYRRLKAGEIVARIADSTPEELAVVELYEQSHRRRKSVLAAVERQLRVLANRP